MLVEIVTALAVASGTMVVIGTIMRSILGLRSGINWLLQTAVIAGIVALFSVTTIQTAILLATPTVVHLLYYILKKRSIQKIKRGEYGEEAKWAYELFEEDDRQFIHAQNVLPEQEVTEIAIIADSKQELRELMIERHNELAQNT